MMTKEKLADLIAEGQKHAADARAIAEKAEADFSAWTEEMKTDFNTSMTKGKECAEKIKTARHDLAVMGEAKALSEEIGAAPVDDDPAMDSVKRRMKNLGLTVVESPEFKACLAPFTHGGETRIPNGTHVNSAPISVKSLITGTSATSAGAFTVNERTDIVEMLGRRPLKVRDLVSKRRTTSDVVEFVQEQSHTNNAAVVAEATTAAAPTSGAGAGPLVNAAGGGYKPEGAWAFVVVPANVKTIAEWVPITKRALADVAQLEGLINDELAQDVAEAEENEILNGDGTGDHFTGINATSGIQTQAFATDLFTSVRKGITLARTVGRTNPTALLVNPMDAEAIDLTKDGNQQYYYGGPQALGQRTLWGLPIVESEAQQQGFALLGDFSKAVIWDREQTTVTMTDSHADFFIRNLVAVLAEERLAFGVVRPSAFVKVDVAA